MYFYHAITAMERNMKGISKEQKKSLKGDIRIMQRAETEDEFFKLAELFLEKWRGLDIEPVSL
jgi:hypothetical protein